MHDAAEASHPPTLASAGGSREYWEDGSAFQHLQRRADEVAAARKAIEAARQASLRRGRLNPAYVAQFLCRQGRAHRVEESAPQVGEA